MQAHYSFPHPPHFAPTLQSGPRPSPPRRSSLHPTLHPSTPAGPAVRQQQGAASTHGGEDRGPAARVPQALDAQPVHHVQPPRGHAAADVAGRECGPDAAWWLVLRLCLSRRVLLRGAWPHSWCMAPQLQTWLWLGLSGGRCARAARSRHGCCPSGSVTTLAQRCACSLRHCPGPPLPCMHTQPPRTSPPCLQAGKKQVEFLLSKLNIRAEQHTASFSEWPRRASLPALTACLPATAGFPPLGT